MALRGHARRDRGPAGWRLDLPDLRLRGEIGGLRRQGGEPASDGRFGDPDPLAQRRGASAGGEVAFPLPRSGRIAGRTLQEAAVGVPGIRIAEYLPDGAVWSELREGPAGKSPGIEFLLTSGQERVQAWLIADDPGLSRRDLGPVEVEFRRTPPGETPAGPLDAGGITGANLHVSPSDGSAAVHIPLPEKLGEEIPCGQGVVARVKEYFLRARVVNGELIELDSGEINPAAVVEIRAGSRSEVHTVFSRYPDLKAVESDASHRPLTAGVHLEASAPPAKPRIAILLSPDHELRVQTTTPSDPSAVVPASVGQTVSLTALGLDLRLERLVPSARVEFGVKPSRAGGESGASYVRLEAELNGTSESVWLQRGGGPRQVILDGGGQLEAAFGPQLRTLPFAIALEEFELIRYPGSSRPAEYRSRVQVKPATPGLPPRDEIISMNRPLGFRRLPPVSEQLQARAGGETGRDDLDGLLRSGRADRLRVLRSAHPGHCVGPAWGAAGRRSRRSRVPGRVSRRRPWGAPWPRVWHRLERLPPPGGPACASSDCSSQSWPAWRRRRMDRAQSASVSMTGDEARLPVEETRGWAILADGRAKPLLTYANETTLAITGREHFDGMNALEILWGFVLDPREFKGRPYIRVDSLELKAKLGLDASQRRFSFNTLMGRRILPGAGRPGPPEPARGPGAEPPGSRCAGGLHAGRPHRRPRVRRGAPDRPDRRRERRLDAPLAATRCRRPGAGCHRSGHRAARCRLRRWGRRGLRPRGPRPGDRAPKRESSGVPVGGGDRAGALLRGLQRLRQGLEALSDRFSGRSCSWAFRSAPGATRRA